MAKKKQVKRSQTKVERLAAQAQEAERARTWPEHKPLALVAETLAAEG